MDRSQVINLNAGPSALPLEVLEEASRGLLNYENTGMGLTELSHRSKEFDTLTKDLVDIFRKNLEIPETHEVLFTQGGGSLQFSAVVLNLLARHRLRYPDLKASERVMDYVITGSWSKKAHEEAKHLGGGMTNVVIDSRKFSGDGKSFDNIPPVDKWSFSKEPAFVYYCANETVDGVEFDGFSGSATSAPVSFPFHLVPPDSADTNILVPVIADLSSTFFSRSIPDLSKHALIYAGAQKNVGPAGLTILIVRKDLLVDSVEATKLGAAPIPTTLSYAVISKAESLYHTPPMFSMYVTLLVIRHFEKQGGLEWLDNYNKRKTAKVYGALAEGEAAGVLRGKVKDGSRSRMNVVFEVLGNGAEKRFLEAAQARGLRGVKGHR
jgi:phosphoserine aminotransferase